MSDIKDKLTDIAGEAVGAAISAGIGMGIAGPPGAIAGATIGTVIKNVGSEILSRFLSKREKERIELVYEIAIKKIEENEKAGKKLRGEEFFSSNVNDRSPAEEICEGVLLASSKRQ